MDPETQRDKESTFFCLSKWISIIPSELKILRHHQINRQTKRIMRTAAVTANWTDHTDNHLQYMMKYIIRLFLSIFIRAKASFAASGVQKCEWHHFSEHSAKFLMICELISEVKMPKTSNEMRRKSENTRSFMQSIN